MHNDTMSKRLREHALELEKEGGNLFRARAFRTAASLLLMMSRPVSEVFEQEGRAGLERLPGIGKSLAYVVEMLLRTGELITLHPPREVVEPEQHLASLPGVGLRTEELLRDKLGITTLESLREAALQGRLVQAGIGPRRLAELLAEVDRRLGVKAKPVAPANEPAIDDLLRLDEEYRRRAAEGDLPTVAPRSFNPEQEPWLGILRGERNGWKLRAMYSNTAVAHRLEKTRDWVVVYFDAPGSNGQRTVVTETRGDLTGKRVVRGREQECRAFYRRQRQPAGEPAA
jgi:DNA polymerase (family 10)